MRFYDKLMKVKFVGAELKLLLLLCCFQLLFLYFVEIVFYGYVSLYEPPSPINLICTKDGSSLCSSSTVSSVTVRSWKEKENKVKEQILFYLKF